MKLISSISLIFLSASLMGCGNKFEECIQTQQEEYRAKNPDATYSQVSHLRSNFEVACANFKK